MGLITLNGVDLTQERCLQALGDYIVECRAQNTTFAYGIFDCLHFSLEAIQRMGGPDLAADYTMPDYSNLEESLEVLAGMGTTLTDLFLDDPQLAPFKHVYPLKARRGDLVIFNVDNVPAVGMVSPSGNYVMAAAQPAGIIEKPLTDIIHAWSIL